MWCPGKVQKMQKMVHKRVQKCRKWSINGSKWGQMESNEAKWSRGPSEVRSGPGPVPPGTTRVRTVSQYHHAPGTTTTALPPPCPRWLHTQCVSEAGHGSPGFFWLRHRTLNTDLSENHHFLMSQNGPVKNGLFWINPYLILLCFYKITVFAIFADFPTFWPLSETPLVYDVFHCFRSLRFPNGICRKWLFF